MRGNTFRVGAAITAAAAMVAAGAQAGLAANADGNSAGIADTATSGTATSAKPTRAQAVAWARSNISAHGNPIAFGAKAAETKQSTKVRDVIVDNDGSSHVRMDRTYQGLDVVGGDFVVHQTKTGGFKGASGLEAGGQGKALAVDTRAKVDAKKAVTTGAGVVSYVKNKATAELVVDLRSGQPRLAYRTSVTGIGSHGEPRGDNVYVDANTGKVIRKVPTVFNEEGTGKSLYLGDVKVDTTKDGDQFTMVDPNRGGGKTLDAKNKEDGSGTVFGDADNAWGDGTDKDPATAGVDAHVGVATTWDYYKTVHGRNGIADDGKGAESYVHVGTNWFNASWSDGCFCMSYGDGDGTTAGALVELDIAGHEMSHGVTSRTANLEYVGESGGLNEATSDIFGTMVEFTAKNTEDPADYVLGEEIFKDFDPAKNFIRRMDKPSVDGSSYDCFEDGIGDVDVHYSSGLANHFFYLLSEGSGDKDINGTPHSSASCDSSTVTGIGNDKAEKIWYKALVAYMTSTTDYHGAREATLSAAKDLYGADSAEYKAVDSTWKSVKVEAAS